jgi:hypothetical protein
MLTRHARIQVAVGLALASLAVAAPVEASSTSTRPLADGAGSAIGRGTELHCHDLSPSGLQCFGSAADRDLAVREISASSLVADRAFPAGATSTGYVIAYAAISYGGNSVVLTQNYANLGTIGWNDIISSYKVFTSLTGRFYENTSYGGLLQQYCCFSNVYYVGDIYNDRFSSFTLP